MANDNKNALQQPIEAALALQQQGQVEESIQILQDILKQFPEQPDALHGLGMAYAQKRDYRQAVVYLQQAVKAAPAIAEFHNNLGNAFKAVGKIDEAMRHYHEALRIKPTYPQAHNNLGVLLYKIGKIEDAVIHYQKSIRMDPNSVDTHYNLANCYVQLDRLLDAATHYQEVLKLRPDHLGALHNLGITFCALKRFPEALPLLSQVIEREPNNLDALFHLGVIYSALAKAEEAKSCFERVLSIDPNHGNSHHNLATIYLHLNQTDAAIKHYKEALRLQPHNKTAAHMIAALSGQTLEEGAPYEYTRALFDQYAYNYDKHVKDKLQFKVPYLLRDIISPFAQSAQKPWDVLDLGCGTGLCAPLFADIAGKMVGVDVSPNMIEVARQQGGYYKLHVMDIQTYLNKHIDAFDLIIASDVFVYFGDLKTVFASCYKTLRAQGYFCFSVEKLTLHEQDHDKQHPHYQLRKTGRYAHANDYIQHISESCGFKLLAQHEAILRYQEDNPVNGDIFLLSKSL
jgi:predicted TPR repeat methyltransferase